MSAQVYTFGPFSLDAEQRLLFREDKPVPLGPKLVDILLLLVRNAGRLVEKDELMNQIWPDAFVEEGNLAKNIFVLRQALGNGDGGREYIQLCPNGATGLWPASAIAKDRAQRLPKPPLRESRVLRHCLCFQPRRRRGPCGAGVGLHSRLLRFSRLR